MSRNKLHTGVARVAASERHPPSFDTKLGVKMSALALRTSSVIVTQPALQPTAKTGVVATAKAYVVSQPPFVNSIAVKAPKVAPATKLRLVKTETAAPKSQWQAYVQEDAQGLLRALQRMVNTHPLVRSAMKGQAAQAGTSALFSAQDLAHDLYLVLLQKDRFRHYLESGMADADIEREIFQVELTNHLIGILRRCRPENYRMVRRIGVVLETDARFKVMRGNGGGNGNAARYRQSAETAYGLAEWEPGKSAQDGHSAMVSLTQVSMRTRDLRRAGCSGDTQLIVSNQELAVLLVEILQAIDGPAPLRVLRQFALSKLPVWDVTLTPIETDADEQRLGGVKADALASAEANPAEQLTQQEEVSLASSAVHTFLARLHALTKENAVRTERLCRVLWHCYFDPAEPSQLAIAEIVGVSDSSVGDYRRKLETEMRRLSLSFTQVAHFSEALREELCQRLFGERFTKEAVRTANPMTLPLNPLTAMATVTPPRYAQAGL